MQSTILTNKALVVKASSNSIANIQNIIYQVFQNILKDRRNSRISSPPFFPLGRQEQNTGDFCKFKNYLQKRFILLEDLQGPSIFPLKSWGNEQQQLSKTVVKNPGLEEMQAIINV
ncbi:unnamed protein product [Allacma fusca]|uniref:Uncharacterized protein n=1 Tax=Allacma fusca TaxID=39272 RepID=A0A8J2NY39_9HEXA|nr:unnamed protein product [Allacma fusca]